MRVPGCNRAGLRPGRDGARRSRAIAVSQPRPKSAPCGEALEDRVKPPGLPGHSSTSTSLRRQACPSRRTRTVISALASVKQIALSIQLAILALVSNAFRPFISWRGRLLAFRSFALGRVIPQIGASASARSTSSTISSCTSGASPATAPDLHHRFGSARMTPGWLIRWSCRWRSRAHPPPIAPAGGRSVVSFSASSIEPLQTTAVASCDWCAASPMKPLLHQMRAPPPAGWNHRGQIAHFTGADSRLDRRGHQGRSRPCWPPSLAVPAALRLVRRLGSAPTSASTSSSDSVARCRPAGRRRRLAG